MHDLTNQPCGYPGDLPNLNATSPPAPRPANDLLRFFGYEHLPPNLQTVSKPLGDLARQMAADLPVCAETTAGLRKLLEAKDCFVRAALPSPFGGHPRASA